MRGRESVDVDRFFREFEGDPEFERERAIPSARTNLAINLLRVRRERGVSQAELAARAGMRQPRIAEIESGDNNPRLDTVARLAWAVGVTAGELVRRPSMRISIGAPSSSTAFVVLLAATRGPSNAAASSASQVS